MMRLISPQFLALSAIMLSVLLVPETAFAANSMSARFATFLQNDYFTRVIDFGLIFLFLFKLLDLIQNFNPQTIFRDVWVPGVILFFAFMWKDVVGWFL